MNLNLILLKLENEFLDQLRNNKERMLSFDEVKRLNQSYRRGIIINPSEENPDTKLEIQNDSSENMVLDQLRTQRQTMPSVDEVKRLNQSYRKGIIISSSEENFEMKLNEELEKMTIEETVWMLKEVEIIQGEFNKEFLSMSQETSMIKYENVPSNMNEEDATMKKAHRFFKCHLEQEVDYLDDEEEEHKLANINTNNTLLKPVGNYKNLVIESSYEMYSTKKQNKFFTDAQFFQSELIQQLIKAKPLNEMNLQEINNEQYEYFEKIGEGGFGFVEKRFDYEKKEFVAFKFIKNTDSEDIREQVLTEKYVLEEVNKLRHPSFVKFYGLFFHAQTNCFVFSMEYGLANMSQILAIMKENNLKFKNENVLYILKILVNAFLSAQKSNIVNRDVKPTNIILTENKEGELDWKIIDFGIGCEISEGVTKIPLSSVKGLTKAYAAPELTRFQQTKKFEFLENLDYDPYKADVFSLGKVVLKLLQCKSKRHLNDLPRNLVELLMKMLEEDPNERFSFEDVMIYLNTELGNIKKVQPDLTRVIKILKEKEEEILNTDLSESKREQRGEEYMYFKNLAHNEDFAEKFFRCDTYENYKKSLDYSSKVFTVYSEISYNFKQKIRWFSFILDTYDQIEKKEELELTKGRKFNYPITIIDNIFNIITECFQFEDFEKVIDFTQKLCDLHFLIISQKEISIFYLRIFKNLNKILELFPER